jgi:hypothetical protein
MFVKYVELQDTGQRNAKGHGVLGVDRKDICGIDVRLIQEKKG